MKNILKKTLELNEKERMDLWLNIAEELGEEHDFECLIENVDDIYLKDGKEEKKLFGFYVDSDIEQFFILNKIDIDYNEDNTCTMTFKNEKYQAETVDLINRHGDDLCEETVIQLHTLTQI